MGTNIFSLAKHYPRRSVNNDWEIITVDTLTGFLEADLDNIKIFVPAGGTLTIPPILMSILSISEE